MKCNYCGQNELLTGDINGKCGACKIKEGNFQSNAFYMKEKWNKFVNDQQDLPKEFVDIVNKNFWSII